MDIKGNIYKKTLKGKTYYSHQYRENGKMVTKNVSETEAYRLSFQITHQNEGNYEKLIEHRFHSQVEIGASLFSLIEKTRSFRARDALQEIGRYLSDDRTYGRVLVLYGLRRSGKTTLMMQAMAGLPLSDFAHTAYVKVGKGEDYLQLNEDLDFLFAHGINRVFIDEITLMDDFISVASVYSDIYAMKGKVVLSGTDSLGFVLSSRQELYDRAVFLHTSMIPYAEWSRVLGIDSIDAYIEYGGSMSYEGIDYNKEIKNDFGTINEYVDTAIAHNIIHSLRNYDEGSRFVSLMELDRRGELVNVINRIVEDTNHRFAIDTILRDFKSRDLGSLRQLLQKEKEQSLRDVAREIDVDQVTASLMKALDIINKEKQTFPISEAVLSELEEYLRLLDVTRDIKVISAPSFAERIKSTFIPLGLRFAQAKELLNILLNQEAVSVLPSPIKSFIKAKLLSDVKGRMLEEIVLWQTALANPHGRCFQYSSSHGEYDMVLLDQERGFADIFEIKYSQTPVLEQAHFLLDPALTSEFEAHFYPIRHRSVLYQGEDQELEGVRYQNVGRYLKEIYK